MKKLVFLLFSFSLIVACTATNSATSVFDETYGYAEKNPIKTGDLSPTNSHRYLSSLEGPNGEEISYGRVGSCCEFKTKNGFLGNMGLLDKYWVTYSGKKDSVYLYLNIYDKAELGTPKGFKRK
ncbi:2-dehydro-3-deoxyphosphooctonate aldolase [Chryseobacterium chendengshani]|uniref:2-dehydro-3-deoxyphosphooctonate aldolase n=1 Tax=unclassified Chryseobacterium TaxID=2593645 RepID=UPI001C63DF8F|nr:MULTISPECIES: 2-dehydro-3-deoxyphosphooctonate aldolase [unclassified Chryseobacterium]MBW7676909.1 2-dehydro-3-deoxyphosphooctonate aldolase [Chryseobacterium sp. LJ756]MBW8524581.1 2-dehydro-3-deoxyphosphooctonate aldolase [Chryseobacterium sp. LJ668]QYK17304.1 2-dehydro-3-deoxyphosphooctonate aldolase [Chryseobacterium sp. LJ668]